MARFLTRYSADLPVDGDAAVVDGSRGGGFVMRIDELRVELERVAPDWNWVCEEVSNTTADQISPRTLRVMGKNRQTGIETIPIHVSAFPNAKAPALAAFICDVLMINLVRPAEAEATLLERR